VKSVLAFVLAVISFVAAATEIVDPPLNAETLIGSWEALFPQFPPTLLHMEIKKGGDSYLAETTVGARYVVVRRLIFSEVKNGNITLHFDKTTNKELGGAESPELWIVGTGEGTATRGGLDVAMLGHRPNSIPPPSKLFGVPAEGHIYFVKGTWTQALGEESKKAEQAIKEQKAAP
jgi:hypothetical protein